MWHEWSTLKKLIWLHILQGASAIIKTVTGTSPLVLENAVNKAIQSLTQYGKCEQNGTPAPDNPVDIYCNNGKLAMVDDELPAGYKRLLGITFDGSFRYETGEYLTGDDDVTMTLDNLSSSGKNVFGSYNGTNDKNFSLYIYGSTSGSYFRYGDQLKRPKYGGTGRRTITFGKSGTTGFADDSEVTPEEFTTPANTYIGMLPNSSSSAFTGDIIGSILVSNRLEWIPCERESDGVIGYYEKYNRNFIAPTGSGTPVSLGYDTSHLVLSVVGTPEVLTVTGADSNTQTASAVNLLSIPDADYADTQEIIGGMVTRKCRIVVFNGTEDNWNADFSISSGAIARFYMSGFGTGQSGRSRFLCTHFKFSMTNASGVCYISESGNLYFERLTADGFTTKDAWLAYLAAQYANGTPVIIVYPLAEEATETVTAQPLNTTKGDNTISVTAEVSGIKLSAQYYAKE